MLGKNDYAHRHLDRADKAPAMTDADPLYFLVELLSPPAGIFEGRPGKYEDEFLSAVTACDVLAPDTVSKKVADAAQQHIARRMAVSVIKLLEVVYIDHDETERLLITRYPADFPLERLFHIPPVE